MMLAASTISITRVCQSGLLGFMANSDKDKARGSCEYGDPMRVLQSLSQPGHRQTISHKGRDIGQHEHIRKRQYDDAPVPGFAFDDG